MGDFNELGGYRAMVRLLDKPTDFSAVIALNDQMAYAMLALSESGFVIPGMCHWLVSMTCPSAYTMPPLTQSVTGKPNRRNGRLNSLGDGRRLQSIR